MITATFLKSKRGNNYLGYRFEGHANYAVRGQDIVCAGVSSLFESFTNHFGAKHYSRIEDQSVTIDTPGQTDNEIFQLLKDGVEAISVIYPDYVQVVTERIDLPLPHIGAPMTFEELLALKV